MLTRNQLDIREAILNNSHFKEYIKFFGPDEILSHDVDSSYDCIIAKFIRNVVDLTDIVKFWVCNDCVIIEHVSIQPREYIDLDPLLSIIAGSSNHYYGMPEGKYAKPTKKDLVNYYNQIGYFQIAKLFEN